MFIILLYIFILIVVLMRLFELKESIIEIWNEDESVFYKVSMSIFSTSLKFTMIALTCFFSHYFIESFLI